MGSPRKDEAVGVSKDAEVPFADEAPENGLLVVKLLRAFSYYNSGEEIGVSPDEAARLREMGVID